MNRLPLTRSATAAVGLVLLLGVAGSIGLLVPKISEVKRLRAQLAREIEARRSWEPLLSVSPITETERQLWSELERRLHTRYPTEPEFPKALGAVAHLARASGMELVSLEIQAREPAAAAPPQSAPAPVPFEPPAELALNPSAIRLVARGRYRELVEFLERLPRAPVYVAVRSLDVKRAEDRLVSEIFFVSLRWGK